MLARVRSATVFGIDAADVFVEVDVAPGLPSFTTVGQNNPNSTFCAAERERLLPRVRLAADDVQHGRQPGRKQDRDIPVWPTLSWAAAA